MSKNTTKSTQPKVVKVDDKIKKEVKDEKDNKKIIIISLILAILIAVFAYWQISKNNDEKDKKPTENKNEVVEKVEDQISVEDEEDDDKIESNFLDYVKEQIKPVKVEKEEEAKKYYSISFETNGGNTIEEQILAQDEVTTLVLPLKEGWVFEGWYKDIELTEQYIFGEVLTEDITVYAKWGKYITYILEETLYEDENIVSENEIIPFLSEDKVGEVPNGMIIGWFIEEYDEAGELSYSKEIFEGTLLTEGIYSHFDSEEVILTAKYLEVFNVEFFESENAEEALHLQEVVEGREIPFEEVGTIVKEKFADIEDFGWYYLDEMGAKWNVSANQKADKLITKMYLDETYTLIYTEEPEEDRVITEDDKLAPNGNIILKEENVSKDSQIKEEDIFKPLEKEGYEFIGWFLIDELTGEATEEMFTEETIIDGNKIYVAKWKEVVSEDILDNTTEPVEPTEEIIPEEQESEEEVVENTMAEIQASENNELEETNLEEVVEESSEDQVTE